MTLVASVNGKRAAEFKMPVGAPEAEIISAAQNAAGAKLAGADIIKTIVVPNRMVNFVVKK